MKQFLWDFAKLVTLKKKKHELKIIMQVDRVVRRPHVKSEGQGFKLRSVHLLEQYHSGPEFNSSPLVDSQLACLLPVGIFTCYVKFEIFV